MATDAAKSLVFEAKNSGKLPVPPALGCFMVVIFGVPALMLIATTWKELPKYPWLAAVYVGAFFPLAVLYVLKRLMTRYALRVFDDGTVEIVFPFKTVRINKSDLASVALQSTYLASAHARRSQVVLGSHQAKVLAAFSPSAFDAGVANAFLDAVRRVNPDCVIRQ